MPVVQPCPYPNCGQVIPLRTGGLPSALCPQCGSELLYCPRSGKLHSVHESVSTAPGYEGEPLRSSLRSWSGPGGSPSGHWSTESARPLRLTVASDPQFFRPPQGFPIAALVVTGGRIVYAHGPYLQGYWPGAPSRQSPLREMVPAETWRLLACRGKAYAVQEDGVDIVDLAAWGLESRIPGRFVAHTHTESFWLGAAQEGGTTTAVVVGVSGEPGTRFPLAGDPTDFPKLAANAREVFAGYGRRLYRIDGSDCVSIAELDGPILHIATLDSRVLVLAAPARGIVWKMLDREGRTIGEIDAGSTAVFQHPVIMGDRGYLFDTGKVSVLECSFDPPRVLGSKSIPTLTRIDSVCGSWFDQTRLLAFAGLEGSAGGRVLLMDVHSGATSQLAPFTGENKIRLASIGDKIILAKSASYENSITVYELGAHA
ncbi:MAG TPA: IBR domain-containing protein [Fimbriimonadaceae bacterium]|nr:IBR domain-containing protein [Fimbriimonadaceae bacterium]HRJ97354.1 IBR domain-containing protein [Fimbriimonadaceae bacterium]